MDENPYAASSLDIEAAAPRANSNDVPAQEVFWAWEKFRVVFNVVLAAIVVLLLNTSLTDSSHWEFLVEGAVAANIAFCLGPVAEGYLAHLGTQRRATRIAIFVLGTLLGALLTVAWIFMRVWDP